MLVAPEIDPELFEACRSGDRDAFRALFEIYKNRVYSIALRYSGNHSTAMNVTQNVFVSLFAQMARFRGESSFEVRLYRLVVKRCLDHVNEPVILLNDAASPLTGSRIVKSKRGYSARSSPARR